MSDVLGRRFTVTKATAWFPRDFVVMADDLSTPFMTVQNAIETYTVSRARFHAEYDKGTLVESTTTVV